MKTKRRATRLPSHSQPEEASPQPGTPVNLPLETHITCSLLATKTVEPQPSSKKIRFDNVIVRRSQRIQSVVPCRQMIHDAEPVIQILNPCGSEQDDLRNYEQHYPEPELNQSRIEDIEPAPPNQVQAESEKETEDDDTSEENSLDLEPKQPINDKSNGSKSKGFTNKSQTRFRTLYVESQKLEKLTHANNELSLKLAVAEGKLEVYEKGSEILASIIDKPKDLSMATALTSASKHAVARTTTLAKPRRKTSTAQKEKKSVASLR